MSGILKLVRKEPNLILAVFTALFAMLMGFDVIQWTDTQMALVIGFLSALIAAVRFIVTPVVQSR